MANSICLIFPTEVSATFYMPPLTKKQKKIQALNTTQTESGDEDDSDYDMDEPSTSRKIFSTGRNPVGKLITAYDYCKGMLFAGELRKKLVGKNRAKKIDDPIQMHVEIGE